MLDYNIKFAIYYPYYKENLEIPKSAYNSSLFWLLSKLSLLVDILFNNIFKIIKPSYNVQEVGNHWFATYHPYYKDKLINNSNNLIFIFAVNYLYFLGD